MAAGRQLWIWVLLGAPLVSTIIWFALNSARLHPEKITLAEANQPVFALIYIAEEKGYFDEEGLDITYRSFTSGRDALTDVLEGNSDIATVYETPVVLRSLEGFSLGIVSTLHSSTKNTGLVARRDAGITVPADLKGKRIGITPNTNGEFFLSLYLTSQGIGFSDVNIVTFHPQELSLALANGSVDAVATWNPNLFNAQKALAEGETITFWSDVYTELSVLAGTQTFMTSRAEALHRLVRGLLRAEKFLQNNEQEALQLVLQRLPNYPEATIRGVWKAFKAEAKLNNVLLSVLQSESQWFTSKGVVKEQTPDYREIIFENYLKKESSEAVTLLK
ncbi:ABC transporter substrate-binding protein [Amphritea sp. HPY]|uniref:ABC transporter substrate-binding protein n=1 Tax=Amphritea sp. HPY TaxID=3421652 RepID=UPI003D7E4FC0